MLLAFSSCIGPHSVEGPSPVIDEPSTATLTLSHELETAASIRLILLGDTGENTPERDQVIRAIRAEEKDLVVVLGDLVYQRGPRCAEGTLTDGAEVVLDNLIGDQFRDIGAPTLLLLGNHDVIRSILGVFRSEDAAMEACYLAYGEAMAAEGIHLPARHYSLRAGPVTIAAVNSNGSFLDAAAADMANAAFSARDDDWDVLVTHQVYRTYHDRDEERDQHLRRWMDAHDVAPAIVANGHSHLLQAGVYNETGAASSLIAITSGTAAKTRVRPECGVATPAGPEACGPGQIYGSSHFGYAVLDVGPRGVVLTFKDQTGARLWSCRSPAPGDCVPDP